MINKKGKMYNKQIMLQMIGKCMTCSCIISGIVAISTDECSYINMERGLYRVNKVNNFIQATPYQFNYKHNYRVF